MIWLDYTIIGVILVSTLISLVRGFVKEVLSLATWVLAVLVARFFATDFSDLLTDYISDPRVRMIAAYVILFVGALLAGSIANYLISTLVKSTGLSGTDRTFGMLFGAARGIIIVALLVALMVQFTELMYESWWQQSMLLPYFEDLADILVQSIPTIVSEEQ